MTAISHPRSRPVAVFGFDEVVSRAAGQRHASSSAVYADMTKVVIGPTILQMDGPSIGSSGRSLIDFTARCWNAGRSNYVTIIMNS